MKRSMFFNESSRRKSSFKKRFKSQQQNNLFIGLGLLLLFLGFVYFGPLNGDEKLGLLTQKLKSLLGFASSDVPEFTVKDKFVAGEAVVKFKPETAKAAQEAILNANEASVLDEIPQIGAVHIKVPDQALDNVIDALSHNPSVVYAEKNPLAQILFTPNDTDYIAKERYLSLIQPEAAWDTTHGNPAVRVAIVDTGISKSHPDLAGKAVLSKNFTPSTTDDDVFGHGTSVSGVAAPLTNNSTGVAGIGFDSLLINAKAMNDDGLGSYTAVTSAVIWAADNGANVINMSLGGSADASYLHDAVDYAWSKGVVVVAAAGNQAKSDLFYPAAYPNVIGVGATDWYDKLAVFSNFGDWVDVMAPGTGNWTTTKEGSYVSASGTSLSSPVVAGLAGLAFSAFSDKNGNGLVNDEIRACIITTADNIGSYPIPGGRVSATKTIACRDNPPTWSPPALPSPLPSPSPAPAVDTSPPNVSVTSPTNGSVVAKKSTVTIGANASDNVAVARVEIRVNGKLICTDSNQPYSCQWSVGAKPNATYTIEAKAYDAANNSSTSPITVTAK